MIISNDDASSNVVFKEDFRTRHSVQARGGVIVGCVLNGSGVSPTSLTDRITYTNTTSFLINSNKMTVAFRTKWASSAGSSRILFTKNPSALNDNQFMIQQFSGGQLALSISTSISEFATYKYVSTIPTDGVEYHFVVVYDGTQSTASNRILWYANGVSVASTMGGTIPSSMRASNQPLMVFNGSSGPTNTFVLRSIKIMDCVWSAEDALDDYQNDSYCEVTS